MRYENKNDKGYIQPEWSIQLCVLLKKNLINIIDAMEYAQIIERKKLPHLRELTLNRVLQLYLDRCC